MPGASTCYSLVGAKILVVWHFLASVFECGTLFGSTETSNENLLPTREGIAVTDNIFACEIICSVGLAGGEIGIYQVSASAKTIDIAAILI